MPTIVGSTQSKNINEVNCPKCGSIVSYYDNEVRRINVTTSKTPSSNISGAIVSRAIPDSEAMITTTKNSILCPKCNNPIFVT